MRSIPRPLRRPLAPIWTPWIERLPFGTWAVSFPPKIRSRTRESARGSTCSEPTEDRSTIGLRGTGFHPRRPRGCPLLAAAHRLPPWQVLPTVAQPVLRSRVDFPEIFSTHVDPFLPSQPSLLHPTPENDRLNSLLEVMHDPTRR